MSRLLAATLFSTVVVLASARAQQGASAPVTLQHRLESGQTFAWALEVEANVHQELGSDRIDSRMRFVLHFVANVTGSKDGVADVAHRIERVEAKADSKLAKIDFDSAVKGSDPGALKQLAALVGQTFVVAVDGSGRIDHVHPPKGLDPGAKDQLGGGDFDTLFSPWFMPLPKEPIAVGGSWEAQQKLLDPQFAGGGTVKVAHKLASITDGRAAIERTFQLPPAPQRQGLKFEVQKSTGSASFDVANGRMLESRMDLGAAVSRSVGSGRTTSGTSSVVLIARAEAVPQATTPAKVEPR